MKSSFETELSIVIRRGGKDRECDTPADILAAFLVLSLEAFITVQI